MLEKLKSINPVIVYSLFSISFLGFYLVLLLLGANNVVIYAACLLAASLSIFKYPEAGLYTIVFLTVIFERFFTLEPLVLGGSVIKLYTLDFVFLITATAGLFKYVLKPKNFHFALKQLDLWLILFVLSCVYFFIRSLTLPAVDTSIAFSAFKNYAFYALMYFLFILVIQTKQQFRLFGQFFNAACALVLVFLLVGVVRGQGVWTEFTPLSTVGVRYLSFPHSFFLTLSIAFTLPLVFYSREFNLSKMSLIWFKGLGVLAGLMRHLWISLFVGLGVIFYKVYRESRTKFKNVLNRNFGAFLLVTSVVLLVMWIYPFWEGSEKVKQLGFPLVERLQSVSSLQADSSWSWRTYAWRDGLNAFMENPVLGIGFGQSLVLRIGDFQQVVFVRELHNSLLVLLVQTGLIGTLFFIAINITACFYLSKILKRRGQYYTYALGILGMYITFLVAFLWQPYLETNIMGIFYWLILGMITFIYANGKEEQVPKEG